MRPQLLAAMVLPNVKIVIRSAIVDGVMSQDDEVAKGEIGEETASA